MTIEKSPVFIHLMLMVAASVLLLAVLAMGSVPLAWSAVWDALWFPDTTDHATVVIVRDFRLPRALTALLVGVALPISGLLMQTFFQNPIAGPYVLGVSAGASLGVAVFIFAATGLGWQIGVWTLPLVAAIGAGGALAVVMAAATRVRQPATLLIVGLMLGSATSAVVMVLQYFGSATDLKRYMLWSWGSLNDTTLRELAVLAPLVAVAAAWSIGLARPLNALLLGNVYAQSMGVSITTIRWQLLLLTAILAGSATAFCGPIAFVGIAVPHATRLLYRTHLHLHLLIGCMLLGMVTMLGCSLLTLLPAQGAVLPINAITALLGAPMVIWLVVRNNDLS